MTPTPATPIRWWRGVGRADRRALLVLVGVPVVLFTLPALAGHPAIVADNLIQNFPLRALAGRQILGGHLPLLNPYTDSGTPLLGGLNAGALYPTTLLFVVLWPVCAWVLNLLVVYVGAGVGLYVLCRRHGLAVRASLLGALSYAYAGAMMGQIVHLGVVQGYSLLPWALVVMTGLSRRLQVAEASGGVLRACATPLVGFAAIWGLVGLSGEPRAIAEMELVTIVAPLAILVLSSTYRLATWRARVAYALTLGLGVAWGVGLALVQLLPGWSFIGLSQRSTISYWFFGSGSLALRWTPMLFVQDLLGGNGFAGQPKYYVGYNLPEVTGYVGLVALVGVAAFVTRLTRRGWVGQCRDFTLFAVVGVVGVAATWGNFTPLGHLFRLIPLFGSARLQSRNVILVDLAGAVLLAWWLDRVEARAFDEAGLTRWRRWFTLWPAFFVAALSLALLVDGVPIVTFLGAKAAVAGDVHHAAGTLLIHVALAVAVIVVVLRQGALRRAMRWLTGLIVADLVVFLIFCSTGLVGGDTIEASPSVAAAVLGTTGRTALVDLRGMNGRAFQRLGESNMNAFTRLPSVQGYGSLLATRYDHATGTHPQTTLNPCAIVHGTFNQLRLASVAVAAGQLVMAPGAKVVGPSWCVTPRLADSTRRYFGQVFSVAQVTLISGGATPVAAGALRVSLLSATGTVVATHEVAGAPEMLIDFRGRSAGGIEVSAPSGLTLHDVVVTTGGAAPERYQLDSPFEVALSTPRWRLVSTEPGYQVFRATSVRPSDWLVGASLD
ncbi:MAG: hypothetical protein ACRDV0_07150, partial [Acidimicrobiales bacterium]